MLIVIAHGSRKPEWRRSVEGIVSFLEEQAGADAVRLAYMDHGPPTLMEVLSEEIAGGIATFHVLPLFLADEGHVTGDVRPMVKKAHARFEGVEIELLPAVGQQPLFREMLLDLIRQIDDEDRPGAERD